MKSARLLPWMVALNKPLRSCLLVAMLVLLCCGIAQAQEIDGTWRLVMRKLPNGTTQVPPAILAAFTVHNGLWHINGLWYTPDGKPASFSRISTYKMSDTEFTETLLFLAIDDGSGKTPAHNLKGDTQSTPVTRQGQRIAFKLPFDGVAVVFEGDKLTATAEGAFVDYWERAR